MVGEIYENTERYEQKKTDKNYDSRDHFHKHMRDFVEDAKYIENRIREMSHDFFKSYIHFGIDYPF